MTDERFLLLEEQEGTAERLETLRETFARFFTAADEMEVDVVVQTAAAAERLRLVPLAKAFTWLGNGWLYPILALVLAEGFHVPARVFMTSLASLVVAFGVYPVAKSVIGRARPCDYEPALARHVEPIDHHSFPSGHAMTAAAFSVPLLFVHPATAPIVLILCGAISWSRVALGHHYLSDVVAGTLLGVCIAGLLSVAIL